MYSSYIASQWVLFATAINHHIHRSGSCLLLLSNHWLTGKPNQINHIYTNDNFMVSLHFAIYLIEKVFSPLRNCKTKIVTSQQTRLEVV